MSARITELNQHQNNTLEVFSSFYELMKPRVMSLVIFTALVGLVIAPTKINFVNSSGVVNIYRTYAKKPGFDSKSLFLTHRYLRETGFLSLPG